MSRGPRPFLADPRRALFALVFVFATLAIPSASAAYPPASTYALDATVTPHATSAPNALFGASLAASDGFLAALVNATAAEIFSVSSGVVQTSSALLVAPDPDDVGDTLSRHGHHFAMADGVVVLGTPAKHLATGGAVAWTHDPTTGEWTGPASLGSSDGVRGGMGYAVATSGGAVIVLGAPDARSGAGAAYVFTRSSATTSTTNPWTEARRLANPGGSTAGDAFGAAVAVHQGADGEGNGWIIVAAPGANAGAGARTPARLRTAGGDDAHGWTHVQELTPSDASAPGGFGASLALTGRYLLVACDPAPGSTGAGTVAGRGEAYLLARSASADFSAEAPADAATHTPTTDEGRWVLDGVLTPPPAPAGNPRRRPAARARCRGDGGDGIDGGGGGGIGRRGARVEETDGRRERGKTVEVSDASDAGDVGNHDVGVRSTRGDRRGTGVRVRGGSRGLDGTRRDGRGVLVRGTAAAAVAAAAVTESSAVAAAAVTARAADRAATAVARAATADAPFAAAAAADASPAPAPPPPAPPPSPPPLPPRPRRDPRPRRTSTRAW